MTHAHLLAIDWGTSSLRGALLDADGRVLDERRSDQGILAVPPGGFGAAFEHAFGDWARSGVPLGLIAGMAGSRQGWLEAPYGPCPAGFEVATAGGGREALARLGAGRFDVVVSDIAMPDMSGVALLRAIRELDLDVPVVLMTGRPEVDSAIEAVSYGAVRYLRKPMSEATLREAVEHAVRLRRVAALKREALRVLGEDGHLVGDRAGLEATLAAALSSLRVATFCAEPTSPAIQEFAMELLTLQASSPDGTPYSNYVVNHWARLPSQLFRMWPGIPGKLVSLLTLALAPRLEDRTPHAARLLQQLREVFSSEVHFV